MPDEILKKLQRRISEVLLIHMPVYDCQRFDVAGHLDRIGLEIAEEAYLQQLLGKVNYVFQVDPGDTEFLAARQWLCTKLRT